MHARRELSPSLQRLLHLQRGVLTLSQALGWGLTRSSIKRLVTDGLWYRQSRSLVSITPQLDWGQRVWAGVLLGGDAAVVTGLAAGSLDGWYRQQGEIHVVSPRKIGQTIPGVTLIRGRRHGRGEPCRVRPEVAVIDAARDLTEDQLIAVLADVVYSRQATMRSVAAALDDFPTSKGRALLGELVGAVSRGIHSGLELRYHRDVEVAHGLPVASRQRRTGTGIVDAEYDEGLIVELDGELGHTGRHVAKDRARDRSHLWAGRLTLRYGWPEVVSQPCFVAAEVAGFLQRLGWEGAPHRCKRCKNVQ